eukprot:TRINITY_DN844_c0_g1_i1.p1 TRINITY_DN844_c0_g1~~TRINITY_DN844_c0_g1_i1.p1  ORF type:complete len:181 (+),score=19.57 TRINITY_DN844_c0_g1_i1:541-1083(+)
MAEDNHQYCESVVQDTVEHNLLMQSLLLSMEKRGCDVTKDFFSCRSCPKAVSGFYDNRTGIVVCENHALSKRQIQETLVHETIHAYDYCRSHNADDCLSMACTEIRANSLSGECSFGNEVKRGHLHTRRQHRACVRRRALISLNHFPHCKDIAESVVDATWSCYDDRQPFEFIPKKVSLE